jgi:hypothetical protein
MEFASTAILDTRSPPLPHTLPPQCSRDRLSITGGYLKIDDKFSALDLKATGHDLSHISRRQCPDQFLRHRAIVGNRISAEVRVISIDGATVGARRFHAVAKLFANDLSFRVP